MCFFKKKEKRRVYPSVYSEWLKEFQRIGLKLMKDSDYDMFIEGGLQDKKYAEKLFESELSKFLEKQLQAFFAQYEEQIRAHVTPRDVDYINLIVRRNDKRFNTLFFFEKLNWLDKKLKIKTFKFLSYLG